MILIMIMIMIMMMMIIIIYTHTLENIIYIEKEHRKHALSKLLSKQHLALNLREFARGQDRGYGFVNVDCDETDLYFHVKAAGEVGLHPRSHAARPWKPPCHP